MSKADIPNCRVFLYEDEQAARFDVRTFIQDFALQQDYETFRNGIRKKLSYHTDHPNQFDFIVISGKPAEELKY